MDGIAKTNQAPAGIGRHDLAGLAGVEFDVLVIGGGITGAGVARHAAQAGLSTLLVERDDFAAGTSSRSTKLIHGGLRYLAMGDIALVREGALERKSLLAMAPHLTEPRWMLVPAASRFDYWKYRLGIGLYERLGAVAGGERHRNLDADALAEAEPLLDRAQLPWACLYREYLTDDARLVLATLRAAARDGAVVCNHVRVDAIRQDAHGCEVRVFAAREQRAYALTARVVVNAAGPWVEAVLNGATDSRTSPPGDAKTLYLSKGIHLVVERSRLPVRNMVMMTAADGRPVFAIARDAVTYVGTTDTPHHGGAEHWPTVEAGDIDYLLATANAHFPTAALSRDDIRATWAGLRPLIHQPGKAPKEMSRRDEIWRRERLITIAGGKLTGFRKMAEEAMAAVGGVLGRSVDMPTPLAPLPGGERTDLDGLQSEIATRYQVEPAVAERLLRLYGAETFAVLGDQPTPISASVFREELNWAATVEGADTLEDALYRRLRLPWYLPDECQALLEPAAAALAELLDWDDARRTAELAATRARLAAELAFT